MNVARPSCLFVLSVVWGFAVWGVGVGAGASALPQYTTGTTRVLIDVLVTRKSMPVPGLRVRDFTLRDRGEVQQIDLLESSAIPLNVLLLFDTSSHHVRAGLDRFAGAAGDFTRLLRPEDRVALLPFGDQPGAMAPLDTTGLSALTGRAGPYSALVDALHAGLLLTRRQPGRTLIIVFSQGEDTVSAVRTTTLLDAASRANAVVHGVVLRRLEVVDAIGFGGSRGDDGRIHRYDWTRPLLAQLALDPDSALPALARLTGGGLVYADRVPDLSEWFRSVVLTFQSRYILAYRPINRDPGWHDVSVSVRARGVQVSARPGYLVER